VEIAAQIYSMSRFLFCDQFLKPRIVSNRIEHWIEPEWRGSEPRKCPKSFRSIYKYQTSVVWAELIQVGLGQH
jgi:hypothetical protein